MGWAPAFILPSANDGIRCIREQCLRPNATNCTNLVFDDCTDVTDSRVGHFCHAAVNVVDGQVKQYIKACTSGGCDQLLTYCTIGIVHV